MTHDTTQPAAAILTAAAAHPAFMPKHHYRPIPPSPDIPPALREALNHNGHAIEEQFDDVRARIDDIARQLRERTDDAAILQRLTSESVDVNRGLSDRMTRLINEVIAERQDVAAARLQQATAEPMRPRAPSLKEILVEAVEEATGRHTVLTSDRARALTRQEIEDTKRQEDAETWRDVKRNAIKIGWRVLGLVAVAVATYVAGHLEGRATAPHGPSAPAAAATAPR